MSTTDSTLNVKNKIPYLRARKQKSGTVFYYFDMLKKEIPLGSDFEMAMKKHKVLLGNIEDYKIKEKAFYLYRHFDDIGLLIYVGITINTMTRLEAHRKTSAWFSNVKRIEIEAFPTFEECEAAERKAIKTEFPLFNLRHAAAGVKINARKLREKR